MSKYSLAPNSSLPNFAEIETQIARYASSVRAPSVSRARAVVVRAREVICVVEGGWGVPCQGVISIKMSKRERTRGGGIRERAGTGRAASRRDAGARRARECGARFPSSATTVRAAVSGALTTIRGTCSISDAPLIRDRNVTLTICPYITWGRGPNSNTGYGICMKKILSSNSFGSIQQFSRFHCKYPYTPALILRPRTPWVQTSVV